MIINTAIGFAKPKIPAFTYGYRWPGPQNPKYEVIDEGRGNWKIRFLDTGALTFLDSPGTIDVFCVGGGAGGRSKQSNAGGGSGYTTTKTVSPAMNIPYTMTIGAGGNADQSGGTTTAFGGSDIAITARGGQNTNGGSGGASTCYFPSGTVGFAGGYDGGNGEGDQTDKGIGQGTTTREFGEPSGILYAGGGGSGVSDGYTPAPAAPGGGGTGASPTKRAEPGTPNTGGGGGGKTNVVGSNPASQGGSGIIIIRNHRGA